MRCSTVSNSLMWQHNKFTVNKCTNVLQLCRWKLKELWMLMFFFLFVFCLFFYWQLQMMINNKYSENKTTFWLSDMLHLHVFGMSLSLSWTQSSLCKAAVIYSIIQLVLFTWPFSFFFFFLRRGWTSRPVMPLTWVQRALHPCLSTQLDSVSHTRRL